MPEIMTKLTTAQKERLCDAVATAALDELISTAYSNVFEALDLSMSVPEAFDATGDDDWIYTKAFDATHAKLAMDYLIAAHYWGDDFDDMCEENKGSAFALDKINGLPDDYTEEQFDELVDAISEFCAG